MPQYRSVDGATLHFEELGQGQPILILPGGVARHPDYLADMGGIAADRRMIIPHLRGTGYSPMPEDPTRVAWWEQALDVEALRVHLGIDGLTLVAHSAGTRIAVAHAVRYPDRINRLILVTPSARYLVDEPSDDAHIHARRRGDEAYEAALARAGDGPPTDSAEAFERWQRDIGPLGYAEWGPVQRAHSDAGRYNFDAFEHFFSVSPPADLADRLAEVRAPVLVVAGAEDGLAAPAPARALSRLFPNGQFVVLGGCGHYPWVDRPEAFGHCVRSFLA